MAIPSGATAPPVRRAKLRVPRLGGGLVPRPRLTSRLEQCLHVPLTLVSAPAGFGKTTLLAEWASASSRPLAWLTVDGSDRDLHRFVAHVVTALDAIAPGSRDPLLALLRQPQPVQASEAGAMLAETLLDLDEEIILVIDDYHLAASVAVESFLAGLLQAGVPALHLVLSTRGDPALPLARMRLQGLVAELRAADLRVSDDEARALLAIAGQRDAHPSLVDALQEQSGGWIASMRLATLALAGGDHRPRTAETASERPLMDFLVEEALASHPAAIQAFLLRASIVDRVCAPLADALIESGFTESSRVVLERLALEGLFLEHDGDQEGWYRFRPLFRGLLGHQLEARSAREERRALHARAGAWFASEGLVDQAIHQFLAAGDAASAARLVEAHIYVVLDREDWTTLAGWLKLLPEALIAERPALLLAKCWVSHFSGRSVPISAMLADLNALLARSDADPALIAAWQAERDALGIAALAWGDGDPLETVAFAQRAVAQVAPQHRLAAGLASFGLGCALQASGQAEEAVRFLTEAAERGEDRIDAGSIRALGGLMFVHRQAGKPRACEQITHHILALAQRHRLPVATSWAHWMLGWLAYARNDLNMAADHFSAVVAERRRIHLHTTLEAEFGLALAYHARAMPVEASSTLRRLLEFILDGNALEYLPLLRAFEARLALVRGELSSALEWLESDDVGIESTSLDSFDLPFLTRIKVLLAEGSAANVARARRDIERMRAHAESRHHAAHRVEVLALSALALAAQGDAAAALSDLRSAVKLAAGAGVIRTFIDLGPAIVPLLRQLAQQSPPSAHAKRILDAVEALGGNTQTMAPAMAMPMLELLTIREAEVLGCLQRRLSYREIGEELFISPQTVKSHVASIYGKLGVGSRREALNKAQAYGWITATAPSVSGT